MLYLSKSKYCGLWQCPKITWLQKYKAEEFVQDESALPRMEAGNVVGNLAMGLFGDYVEITTYKGEKLDIPAMIAKPAPKDALEETPRVYGVASGFLRMVCVMHPPIASIGPIITAINTLGA